MWIVVELDVYDDHLVQVVAMLAQSENAAERKKSRYNHACNANIIDTKVTKVVSAWNEQTRTAWVNGLISLILAGGDSGRDTEDDKVCEYIDDDRAVEGKAED